MISRAAMRRREKLVGFFDFLTSPKERLLEKAQESVRLEKPTPVVESAVQELGEFLVKNLGEVGAREQIAVWSRRLPDSTTPLLQGRPIDLQARKRMWTWEALAVVMFKLSSFLDASPQGEASEEYLARVFLLEILNLAKG